MIAMRLTLAEDALRIQERLRSKNLEWTRELMARLRGKVG